MQFHNCITIPHPGGERRRIDETGIRDFQNIVGHAKTNVIPVMFVQRGPVNRVRGFASSTRIRINLLSFQSIRTNPLSFQSTCSLPSASGKMSSLLSDAPSGTADRCEGANPQECTMLSIEGKVLSVGCYCAKPAPSRETPVVISGVEGLYCCADLAQHVLKKPTGSTGHLSS